MKIADFGLSALFLDFDGNNGGNMYNYEEKIGSQQGVNNMKRLKSVVGSPHYVARKSDVMKRLYSAWIKIMLVRTTHE